MVMIINIKLKNAHVASVPLNKIYNCIKTAPTITAPANLAKNAAVTSIPYLLMKFLVLNKQL